MIAINKRFIYNLFLFIFPTLNLMLYMYIVPFLIKTDFMIFILIMMALFILPIIWLCFTVAEIKKKTLNAFWMFLFLTIFVVQIGINCLILSERKVAAGLEKMKKTTAEINIKMRELEAMKKMPINGFKPAAINYHTDNKGDTYFSINFDNIVIAAMARIKIDSAAQKEFKNKKFDLLFDDGDEMERIRFKNYKGDIFAYYDVGNDYLDGSLGAIMRLDYSKDVLIWKTILPSYDSRCLITIKGELVCTGAGETVQIDINNGKTLWKHNDPEGKEYEGYAKVSKD